MKIAFKEFLIILLLLSFSTLIYSKLNSEPKRFQFPKRPLFNKNYKINKRDPRIPEPKIYWFDQIIDHFNFKSLSSSNENELKWKQRFFICDKFYKKGGPIFFYTGNEGDLEMFYYNSGFMFEHAPKFNALIVFVEHRYYGKSYPSKTDYQYLTSEQALADFAYFLQQYIPHLDEKEKIDNKNNKNELVPKRKVISFGGSYGGMLTAWMRIKYPNIIDGAICCSGPIAHFPGTTTDPKAYMDVLYEDYKKYGCIKELKDSLFLLEKIYKSGKQSGFDLISNKMKLCPSSKITKSPQIHQLYTFIENAYQYMAMLNYPEKTDFLRPLPAYPVGESCKRFKSKPIYSDEDLLEGLSRFVGTYYNFTGEEKCFNISESESPSLGDLSWNIQTCTEMIMPIGNNDEKFIPYTFLAKWSTNDFKNWCKQYLKKHKMEHFNFREKFAVMNYGGRRIGGSSNIVFSNGEYDPYSIGGIIDKYDGKGGNDLIVLFINNSAHHTDLRFSTKNDPQTVTEARNIELKYIQKWLNQ